jgi:hypothetical protein
MMTAEIPMMIPSMVNMERILLDMTEPMAEKMLSKIFMLRLLPCRGNGSAETRPLHTMQWLDW